MVRSLVVPAVCELLSLTLVITRAFGRIAKAVENKPLQREINLHLEGYRFAWEANVGGHLYGGVQTNPY